ncbi:MAG: ftsW, partial [Chlamydiia bacterium]|nr:ftsW [Chlamydiia bacterium]
THIALVKQICYGLFALFIGYTTYAVGYKKLIALSPLLLVVLSFLLLLVFVPGIGISANGARRWISVFGLSLQPSEFMKFTALLYFVHRFLQRKGEPFVLQSFVRTLLPLAIPLGLILIEPNNGTVAVIVTALMSLFFLVRVPFNFWAAPMLAVGLFIVAFALHTPYVKARIEVYLHPELDLKGKGHQPYQAKIASGSGGLFGMGPGASVQKLSYLPEAQNDYIAAIYAEEYGYIGMLVLLSVYGWIAYMGLAIAFQAEDRAGFYVAASFTFLLLLQAFLNLGVVSGLLPSTGLNLPFFSQGGSSLIGNAAGLGILMSIAKETERVREREEVSRQTYG